MAKQIRDSLSFGYCDVSPRGRRKSIYDHHCSHRVANPSSLRELRRGQRTLRTQSRTDCLSHQSHMTIRDAEYAGKTCDAARRVSKARHLCSLTSKPGEERNGCGVRATFAKTPCRGGDKH